MYESYMSLIKQLFPTQRLLLIVFILFNLKSSVKYRVQYNRIDRLYNKYKSYWKLFLKPFETLEAFNYHKVHLFKEWKSEKAL